VQRLGGNVWALASGPAVGYGSCVMTALLAWLVAMELSFVGFAVLAASLQMKRRARFWLRFMLSLLGLISGLVLLAAAVMLKLLPQTLLMPLWLALAVGALILALLFCYDRTAGDSSSGSSEGGDGGVLRPDRPGGPREGLLLADADQATARVRDHSRPKLIEVGPRRPPREPGRRPAPAPRHEASSPTPVGHHALDRGCAPVPALRP
jgi:hypothetical protein